MNELFGGIFLLAVTAVGGFAAGALRQVCPFFDVQPTQQLALPLLWLGV